VVWYGWFHVIFSAIDARVLFFCLFVTRTDAEAVEQVVIVITHNPC